MSHLFHYFIIKIRINWRKIEFQTKLWNSRRVLKFSFHILKSYHFFLNWSKQSFIFIGRLFQNVYLFTVQYLFKYQHFWIKMKIDWFTSVRVSRAWRACPLCTSGPPWPRSGSGQSPPGATQSHNHQIQRFLNNEVRQCWYYASLCAFKITFEWFM